MQPRIRFQKKSDRSFLYQPSSFSRNFESRRHSNFWLVILKYRWKIKNRPPSKSNRSKNWKVVFVPGRGGTILDIIEKYGCYRRVLVYFNLFKIIQISVLLLASLNASPKVLHGCQSLTFTSYLKKDVIYFPSHFIALEPNCVYQLSYITYEVVFNVCFSFFFFYFSFFAFSLTLKLWTCWQTFLFHKKKPWYSSRKSIK